MNKIPEKNYMDAIELYKSGEYTIIKACTLSGFSAGSLYNYLNKKGIKLSRPVRKQKFTEQQMKKALELYSSTKISINDISKLTKISAYLIYKYLNCYENINQTKMRVPKASQEQIEEAIELYQKGYKVKEILQKTKIKEFSLYKNLKKYKVNMKIKKR